MTSTDWALAWFVPVVASVLLGMMAMGIKDLTTTKKFKAAFFAIASSLILITAVLVSIACLFFSTYWAGVFFAVFCVVTGLAWPFLSFWIVPACLPTPKTHWGGKLQVCLIWIFACSSIVLFVLAVIGVLISL